MARRKGIGKIDTEELLLIGGAAAAVYFLTRRTTATAQQVSYPYGYPQQQVSALNQVQNSGNSAASILSAGSSLVSSLADMISSF
jgi:hypothetical protein